MRLALSHNSFFFSRLGEKNYADRDTGHCYNSTVEDQPA